MKKILLIMVAVLMITTGGNCQWLQRKYGVNDINMLSTEQLNVALRKAKVGTWVWSILFNHKCYIYIYIWWYSASLKS